MNAYRKDPPTEEQQRLIDGVVQAHQKVRHLEDAREEAARERLLAVAAATQAGASLRDIASAAGVSPETVRKMVQMDRFRRTGTEA